MPKGYWVVTANITDPEAFTPYRETAGAIIADSTYPGRCYYITRSGTRRYTRC